VHLFNVFAANLSGKVGGGLFKILLGCVIIWRWIS